VHSRIVSKDVGLQVDEAELRGGRGPSLAAMTRTFPSPVEEGTILVADGRRVGFARWGEHGPTILCFHGGTGSRYLVLGSDYAEVVGVRVVCLERPGLGLSDPDPERTICSWATDVEAVADRLALGRFAVVGVSAGGPYALACGALLGNRVSHVGVVAGLVPPERCPDDAFVALVSADRRAAEELASRRFEEMARDVEGSVASLGVGGPDEAAYGRPEVRAMFRAARSEAFRQGSRGAVQDSLLVNSPWGFDAAQVRVRVSWWHGELDPVIPVAAVRSALESLPNADLVVYPGEGHAVGVAHADEILGQLRGDP
jgi:pimeloyl-ACP methyl ester carboxylesterase